MEKNSKIYFKIDWYSAMIHNTTMESVLDSIGVEWSEDLIDLFDEQFMRGTGFGRKFVFSSNGITFEIDTRDVPELFIDPVTGEFIHNEKDGELVNVWGLKLPNVRLDISGSGLDYLRHLGINVEDKLRLTRYNGCKFNVTRCDFAYDLIDYMPDFVSALHKMCTENETETGRIRTGKASGFSYESSIGRKEIVYIGSVGGGQMLRVYNKKLQLENTGRYLRDCPYGTPDDRPMSWIRVELQLRRNRAMGLITADNFSSDTIFRYIYDNFGVRKEDGSICKEWLELYDWNEIPRIIQNLQFSEYTTVLDRAKTNVCKQIKSLIVVMSHMGIDGFIKWICREWYLIQRDDPRRAMYIKAAAIADDVPKFLKKPFNQNYFSILFDDEHFDTYQYREYVNSVYSGKKVS